MNSLSTWQSQALADLVKLFRQDSAVRALVLSGSLADDGVQADAWSDIDVKIVLADPMAGKYFTSVDWLRDFGQIIGLERHVSDTTKTLRICLEDYHRFDFVFIPESTLQDPSAWASGIFRPPRVVLWTSIPDLENQIITQAEPSEYHDISSEDLTRLVEQFWFKAVVAIGKVVRNDLLIGLHMALDLARDCLVLQMICRDREKGTNVHRVGGWGNAVVSRFTYGDSEHEAIAILDLVQQSCEVCDEFASDMIPDYEPRSALLLPTIEAAKHVDSPHIPE